MLEEGGPYGGILLMVVTRIVFSLSTSRYGIDIRHLSRREIELVMVIPCSNSAFINASKSFPHIVRTWYYEDLLTLLSFQMYIQSRESYDFALAQRVTMETIRCGRGSCSMCRAERYQLNAAQSIRCGNPYLISQYSIQNNASYK